MKKIETTREYFGDTIEGFVEGSMAEEIVRGYRNQLHAIQDNFDGEVAEEMARLGYSKRVHFKPEHSLPNEIHTEWETPIHLVRVYKDGAGYTVETAGEQWGGESVDWRKVEVFEK